MLLGSIMTKLQDDRSAAEALLSLGDIVLIAKVDSARRLHDETLGGYVSGAAHRFANLASSEDWLKLMTGIEKSESPAATCLGMMLRWSIDRDANEGSVSLCGCGSNGGNHQCCG